MRTLGGARHLKRSVLLACRDALMIVPCGRSLYRAWRKRRSAPPMSMPLTRVRPPIDLASALVKIARWSLLDRIGNAVAAFLVGNENLGESTPHRAAYWRLLR